MDSNNAVSEISQIDVPGPTLENIEADGSCKDAR